MQSMYFCAGNTFSTGDRVAAALLSYAGAVAQTGAFGVVEVPTRRSDGSAGTVSLLLTPSSQTAAESLPVITAEPDPVDEELIARLLRETDRLLHPAYPMAEAVPAALEHWDL